MELAINYIFFLYITYWGRLQSFSQKAWTKVWVSPRNFILVYRQCHSLQLWAQLEVSFFTLVITNRKRSGQTVERPRSIPWSPLELSDKIFHLVFYYYSSRKKKIKRLFHIFSNIMNNFIFLLYILAFPKLACCIPILNCWR